MFLGKVTQRGLTVYEQYMRAVAIRDVHKPSVSFISGHLVRLYFSIPLDVECGHVASLASKM